ncbi:SurA N-terminal domain-containing protein [uncultured Alistipes sp.]|uniref:SurA N-terminal domain-containing protein n=1 Tax=uncultured Alistipes sp. TaxID=538949 RepID=UPI002665655F|nr:SurA N-terminal domain-containing protein [uncultured Alistipes sp.]
MASLNTLRTKFGIVLSIIIALALLAFILSLKTEMGFSGNDPRVGVIGGEKINYSEYYDEYEKIKSQSGAQEGDEQQSAMLANATWQSLIARYVLTPGFERLGLRVTEPERMAMAGGKQPSQTFFNAFADPRTGAYNVAAVSDFLAQAEANPQAAQAWAQLNEQARMEREMQKFFGLVRGGVYVNALEVARGVEAANDTYAGKWAGKKYSEVPDSLFNVSDSDLRAYYNSHKNLFRQLPSRTISYVVFEVAPTDDDLLNLEKKVTEVGKEFAVTEELKSFVRGNRNGKVADNYVSAAQFSEEEAEALMAGKTYGPVLKNNEWTMARVLSSKMAPDTIGVRHIVLPYTEEKLADSLLTALRGGADFAAAAAQYSVYDATAANGGEVGELPFSTFTGEFAEALGDARQGDIVKIASGDAIQLMQVYRTGKPVKQVQVASITYPVEASAETRRTVHNEAGSFMVNAKGSAETFAEAASTAAVTPRVAVIPQGERTIRGLEDSRDITRWAYGAEPGDVSEIFPAGKDYVVAMLTEIDDDEYASVEKMSAQIRAQVLRDKKYDYIVGQLSGSSLAEQAASLGTEVADFKDVTFSSFYVDGPGFEPRLVGAITSSDKGAVSAPVKGMSGVYVFEVEDVQTADKQTAEGEKVRAQAMNESMAQQFAIPAVQQMAEIQDLRGKYF